MTVDRPTPTQRRKARLVTFRVCNADYEVLAKACIAAGLRSVSEFARVAAFDKIQAMDAPRISLSGDLTMLGRTLGDVDAALREASRRIRKLLGPVHPDPKANVTNGP